MLILHYLFPCHALILAVAVGSKDVLASLIISDQGTHQENFLKFRVMLVQSQTVWIQILMDTVQSFG
jgi:hypothetical protein